MSDNKDKKGLLFSRRNGYLPAKKAIQRESLDAETRNRLWNVICLLLSDEIIRESFVISTMYKKIWTDLFKETIDSLPEIQEYHSGMSKNDVFYAYYKNFFLTDRYWFKCFDFLEFVAGYLRSKTFLDAIRLTDYPNGRRFPYVFIKKINKILEEESSAYRFVDGKFVEITSGSEIKEIDEAIGENKNPVSDHLEKALRFLSDRQNPDFKNSIKEAISAVEAQCCIMLEDPNATLGDALSRLAKKYSLHPALKEGFQKLYGFTSNAGGIRHGNADDTEVDYSLAKYMLVSCSAFVNYLRSLDNQVKS